MGENCSILFIRVLSRYTINGEPPLSSIEKGRRAFLEEETACDYVDPETDGRAYCLNSYWGSCADPGASAGLRMNCKSAGTSRAKFGN